MTTINWQTWKVQFERGHTIASYIFILQMLISAFYLVFYGEQFEYRLIFFISFGSGLGALVDTTAHLYVSKAMTGLSTVNMSTFWRDFFTLRTHVLIGELLALVALSYEIVVFREVLFYQWEILILYILYLIGIMIIIKTRYYH
jgi:hypothetical protein